MQRFTWKPVPLATVTIDDQFWSPRQRLNRERTIPVQYAQCKDTGRVDALRLNWKPGMEPVPHIFWESDIAKWIEAGSYSLATHPDPQLDAQLDETIALLAQAQQPDGYLNVYFTVVKPGARWTDLRDAHELYCAGHLIEAGVAHFEATGKHSLLDVVRRYADHIDSVFGTGPQQKRGYCGHEEIELALVKLYRVTGEARYLALAQYFIDERGREPYYFDLEAAQRGRPGYFEGNRAKGDPRSIREYNQSHLPVREQPEVVGHAVRAMYLYTAMADLAGETGDQALRDACRRLWTHLCTRRMYVTGGLGPSRSNEGFTADYDLPNETAYAETCAAIGLVFWAHRMVHLEADARYTDVLERALYNGVISGISHEGTLFFYDNPLASAGDFHRREWFHVACCPPNLSRLLASLGQYIYSTGENEIAVHLYVQGSADLRLGGHAVTLRQETAYPWVGAITLRLAMDKPATFALYLRLPGWCRGAAVQINGETITQVDKVHNGYLRLERQWQTDDTVHLDLPMSVERIYAHPAVGADAGCVALARGPLVYCLEGTDNYPALHRIALQPDVTLTARHDPDLLGGVTLIEGPASVEEDPAGDEALYRTTPVPTTPISISAIPYYAWDNRAAGEMRVWMREGTSSIQEDVAGS